MRGAFGGVGGGGVCEGASHGAAAHGADAQGGWIWRSRADDNARYVSASFSGHNPALSADPSDSLCLWGCDDEGKKHVQFLPSTTTGGSSAIKHGSDLSGGILSAPPTFVL